jgi:O-acetyl-ADP-ribose deacetylase (regulator of RNase III)
VNTVLAEKQFRGGQTLQLVQGDITAEASDAIVNAANAQLQHGGGVAGVISRRGGPAIQRESDAWAREHGPVSHQRPAYTSGGDLACRYVIHAVGPVWGEGDEDTKLAQAVTGSLGLADQLGLASLSLPAISTGIFGFPKDRAASVILAAVAGYFSAGPLSGLKTVRLVLFDPETVREFEAAWERAGGQV